MCQGCSVSVPRLLFYNGIQNIILYCENIVSIFVK